MEFLCLICNAVQYGSKLLYIDPAATSVLLSSIAAIAVAIAASAIIIWKKVKNNVKKIVKTDPNKNKEVEKDIVVNDESLNEDSSEKSDEKATDEAVSTETVATADTETASAEKIQKENQTEEK